jgi:hypothetical protein
VYIIQSKNIFKVILSKKIWLTGSYAYKELKKQI